MRAPPAKESPSGGLESKLRLKDLQLLVAIEEHRSISGAAASLGLAQPAASRSLMELEQTLRTHLFERDRARGMAPTAAGEVVLSHARTMLADCRLMEVQLDAQRTGAGVHLRLGVIQFAPGAMIEHVMAALTGPPSNMSMSITEGSSTQLIQELQLQRLDAVVARSSGSGLPAELSQELLLRQEACVVVHKQSVLARKEQITRKDFADLKWLLPARGTPTRLFIDEAFTAAGLTPPLPMLEAGSNRIIQLAVRSNRNLVAVVPAGVGKELEKSGGVVSLPWRSLPLPRPLTFPAIGLLFATRHRDTPHISLLLRELRSFLSKPVPL